MRKESRAYQATLDACMLRLRPIMMTSFAFILGVVPLVVSEGAGSEMRRALGTAVFGGMLGVTLFGIFLTPVFYYVIQWINDLISRDSGQTVARPQDIPHEKWNPPRGRGSLRLRRSRGPTERQATGRDVLRTFVGSCLAFAARHDPTRRSILNNRPLSKASSRPCREGNG